MSIKIWSLGCWFWREWTSLIRQSNFKEDSRIDQCELTSLPNSISCRKSHGTNQELSRLDGNAHTSARAHTHANTHTNRWRVYRDKADLIQCVCCWLKSDAAASHSFRAFKHSHSLLNIVLHLIWIFLWPRIFKGQMRYFANCKAEFQIKRTFFLHLWASFTHPSHWDSDLICHRVASAVSHDGLVKEAFVWLISSQTLF